MQENTSSHQPVQYLFFMDIAKWTNVMCTMHAPEDVIRCLSNAITYKFLSSRTDNKAGVRKILGLDEPKQQSLYTYVPNGVSSIRSLLSKYDFRMVEADYQRELDSNDPAHAVPFVNPRLHYAYVMFLEEKYGITDGLCTKLEETEMTEEEAKAKFTKLIDTLNGKESA